MKKSYISMLFAACFMSVFLAGCGNTVEDSTVSETLAEETATVTEEMSVVSGVVTYQNLDSMKICVGDTEVADLNDSSAMYADMSVYDYPIGSTAYRFVPGNKLSEDEKGYSSVIYDNEILTASWDKLDTFTLQYGELMQLSKVSGDFILSAYFNDGDSRQDAFGTEQLFLVSDGADDVAKDFTVKFVGDSVELSTDKELSLNVGVYVQDEGTDTMGVYFKDIDVKDSYTFQPKDIVAEYFEKQVSGEIIEDASMNDFSMGE